MSALELFLIAIGLSMDAFAVAVCIGIAMPILTIKSMMIVGIYFGMFQAIMPLIGYIIGTQFADSIATFADWIAFAMLSLIGVKMIAEGLKQTQNAKIQKTSLQPTVMIPLAIATSIDALAIGVSFAMLQVNIISAVVFIGFITLILCAAGSKIGNIFGAKFKVKPELIGGAILIFMGLRMLN